MKQYRVLFNPLSGDGAGKAAAMHLMELLPDNELRFYDITKIDSVPSFLAKTDPKDTILVAGGDGTLRRFADAVSALPLRHTVYYYATGRDNDFWRDLGRQPGDPPVPVSRSVPSDESASVYVPPEPEGVHACAASSPNDQMSTVHPARTGAFALLPR